MERIVYLRRVEKNDRSRLPKDLMQDAKRPLGASYNKFGQVLKGVTGEEEQKIMPEIVGVSANDPNFARTVERFWFNISIRVPLGGTRLDVTVENGVPRAPFDYIRYKYALKHKNVAPEDKIDANPYALFYIHDPVSDKERKQLELGIRNKAKMKYLEVIQDEKRVDALLTVLTTYKNPSVLEPGDKQVILEEVSTKEPAEFVAACEDEKIFVKSFIYQCINAGVFKESGTRVIYDGEILGDDVDSAVAYLKSKEGSRIRVQAEGKLSQWALNK